MCNSSKNVKKHVQNIFKNVYTIYEDIPMLKRKITKYLEQWKNNRDHNPLLVYGARQIGKTFAIHHFISENYENYIEIDFKKEPQYKKIFQEGYTPDQVLKLISMIDPSKKAVPNKTIIFFDEVQDYPDATTCFKAFKEDGRYDVIASGSMLGVQVKSVNLNPAGFKTRYQMFSLDFEEFLWAYGYTEDQIEELYQNLINLKPLNEATHSTLSRIYKEYIFTGGMPKAVQTFMDEKNYFNVFSLQKELVSDYEDDIVQYVEGLDIAKVKTIYRSVTPQLAKDNHKFQITKLPHKPRSREYEGVYNWLVDAGIINVSYNLKELNIPLSSYVDDSYYRLYYSDHSLFIATMDEESKEDLLANGNMEIYSGALYESLISSALIKQDIKPYFYKNIDSTIELDFVIRAKNMIIPIEVKRKRGKAKSMENIINDKTIPVSKGIKLSLNNIGYNGDIITIPYFLSFFLKRFVMESDIFSW